MKQMTCHAMWTDLPRTGMPVFIPTALKAYADGGSPVPGSTWIQPTSRVPQRT